jgi:hypothetical protein
MPSGEELRKLRATLGILQLHGSSGEFMKIPPRVRHYEGAYKMLSK